MILTIPIVDLVPYERLANGRLVIAVEHNRDSVTVTLKGGEKKTYPASYEADILI
jgi:hypothetical protein